MKALLEKLLNGESPESVTHLNLDKGMVNTEFSSTEGLEACTSLREFSASGQQVTSVAGLETLTRLEHLVLSHNQLVSLAGLSAFRSLRTLDVSFNLLHDLSGLQGLQLLEEVHLENNRLESLEGMQNLPALKVLGLSGNPGIVSLLPLSGFPTITELYLRGVKVSDTHVFTAFPHLQTLVLSASGCVPHDLPVMASLHSLTLLGGDSEPEMFIPSLPNLRSLTLRNLQGMSSLKGLEALPRLEYLDLSRSGIRELNASQLPTTLKRLDIRLNPSLQFHGRESLPESLTVIS